MLTITHINCIRKKFYIKGKSFAAIAKETGYNYRTIKKYVDQTDFNQEPKRAKRRNRSDYLRPHIRACLTQNHHLKRKHRLYKVESIYRYLESVQEIEILISKRRFRMLVAEEKEALQNNEDVYLDLQHQGGKAQVDFGEVFLQERDTSVKKHLLVLTFPYSNAGFCQVTEIEQSEALFAALERIFNHIGRVPGKIWFDPNEHRRTPKPRPDRHRYDDRATDPFRDPLCFRKCLL